MIFLALTGCNGERQAEQAQAGADTTVQAEPDFSVDMLTVAHDPVCGMELTEENFLKTSIHDGQLYGFCSESCKEKFDGDPQKVLSQVEKK
jgi:YHS domain-containing protein